MKAKTKLLSILIIVLCVLMAVPWGVFAQAVNTGNSVEKTQQAIDAQTANEVQPTPDTQPMAERPFEVAKPDKEEITAKIGEEVSFAFEINDPQATAEDTYTIAFKDEVTEGVTPFDVEKIVTDPKPITGKDKKVTVTIPTELTKEISEEEAHSLIYTVTKNDAEAVTTEAPVKITFKADTGENTGEPKKEEGNIAENKDPNVETEKSAPYVSYRTHVENIGWQNDVKNGATAGTTGQSLRLEAMTIKLGSQDVTGNIQYRTHIQNIGWESKWKQNGQSSGTSGRSLRLEAMQVRLTGKMAQKYDIYYRVHAQNFGWLKWAKNGASAGTAGFGYRLEGMQIVLVRKGQKLPSVKPASQDDRAYIVNGNQNVHPKNLIAYQTHVQNIGWQAYMVDGVIAGTSGLSYRLEAMRIKLNQPKYSGNIEYRTHIQNIGWESAWKKNGQTSGTSGKGLRLEAMQVRLTGTMSKKYDVYYRVHAQNYGWLGWAKNGASAGTEKLGLRLEAMQIILVAKGKRLPSYSPASNRKEAFIKKTKAMAISMARAQGYDQIYEGTLKFCTTPAQVKALSPDFRWEWFPDSVFYRRTYNNYLTLPFPILRLDKETTVKTGSVSTHTKGKVFDYNTKNIYLPDNKENWRPYNGKRIVIAYRAANARVHTGASLPGYMPAAHGAVLIWVN